ncbi:Cilia- and flagella-associated protein 99 [Durusdinium trenchii]|uniref:Cilia- and flagella-associated protein 99 n=1 Tax=Durusdinium trenchii TaxID=1381693 RepID=A0ABP0K6V6_9DINO
MASSSPPPASPSTKTVGTEKKGDDRASPSLSQPHSALVPMAASGAKPSQLVEQCEAILKSFNPTVSSVDSHANDVLGENKKLNEADKVFVRQVLYGCVRFKSALKALITSFYFNNSATTSRGDYTKYLVLSYLALFRLDDMGFSNFARLVRSQAPEKMHVFLSYLFDQATLERWVKDEWIKFYDISFVEDKMIGGLQRFKAQADKLREALSHDAFGMAQKLAETDHSGIPQVLTKPPTICEPFRITPARPVRVQEPLKIKQSIKAKPVPKSLHKRSLTQIEAEREAMRAKVAEETLKKYEVDESFKLSQTKDTLTKAVEERERELAKILDSKFQAKPVPDFGSQEGIVKMNAAAVLRETAVYKKKQENEAALLKAYEEDLRDSTEFYEWQSQRREEDEKEKLRLVEQRRLDSIASQREARLANLRRKEENRVVANSMKARVVEFRAENQRQEEAILEEKRNLVARIQSRKDIPVKEKQKIIKANRAAMREMREKQKALERAKKIEDEKEQLRRNDLIRRIRALERVPVEKVRQFDPTASGGHGLLEEMSLLELKERLAMNEIKYKKEEEDLRHKIIQSKLEKEKAMNARLEMIRRARKAAASANRKAKAQSRERDAERQRIEEEIRDEAKLKLAHKLERIRLAREEEIRALQEEEERLHKKNLFLGAAKDMVEEKVHEEFLKGAERKDRIVQARAQREAAAYEAIKDREEAIRVDNRRTEALARQRKDAEIARRISASRATTKEKAYKTFVDKRDLVRKEQARYARAQAKLRKINAYATSMAAGVPIQAIQGMTRSQLGVFFRGKPVDVDKTLRFLFEGDASLDTYDSFDSALDDIHASFDC